MAWALGVLGAVVCGGAALVMEGPAPRATVFVLHGIRDRKESMPPSALSP